MVRFAFLFLGVIAMATSGCCGPRGCGTGCRSGQCSALLAGGPLAAARNARRSLICGSGCGEAYIGEWISTPPDCSDPCCDDQFVGGAVKARPFSRPRGALLRGLYGSRGYSAEAGSTSCGCGESACGSCASGGCSATEHIVTDYNPGGVKESGCGCASCNAASPMASRLSSMGQHPTGDSITASARAKQTALRAQRIRR